MHPRPRGQERQPAIEIHDVHKAFGPVRALDGIDLEVERGTVLGLLGPNGAGKTTLVRVLTTLLAPDGGRATVAGFDVVRDAARVRSVVGLAGQSVALDDHLTGRENLVLVGRFCHLRQAEATRRADELLERFELASPADRRVSTWSGGMRRRLDLAASLVGRPEVLFLDEPTVGLDPRSRIALWEMIAELVRDGTTVLLTTQYLEEADRLASKVAVVDAGRLIAVGTPDELKAQVGGTFVELTVAVPSEVAVAATALASVAPAGIRIDTGSGRVVVPVRGVRDATASLRLLDAAGICIDDLTVRRPSLDDVFLALTGGTGHRTTPAPSHGSSAGEERRPHPPRRQGRAVTARKSPTAVPAQVAARWVVADVLVMARRDLSRFLRVPSLVVFSVVSPVMFVLLFAYVFGGAITIPGVRYVDYLMGGILVQTVVFGSTETGVGLVDDLLRGMIDRFRTLPMARSAVLAGRTVADTVRHGFMVLMITGVGLLIGFRAHGGILRAALALLLVLSFGLALSWVSAAIGLTVRDVEATQTAGVMWTFPLTFTSSAFVPVDSMPGWLQAWAHINPITITVDAVRDLLLGRPASADVVQALVWVAVIAAVFVPLALRRYRV